MDLRVLAAEQDGVLTAAQLRDCRVSRAVERGHVDAGRWLRVRRGVVLVDPARAGSNPGWVAARAVALACPDAVVAGRTAARLHGMDGVPDGPEEVVVAAGRPLRPRPDLVAHRLRLEPREVVTLRGIQVTTPARTLVDLVLRADRPAALAMLDAALRRGLVAETDLPALRTACTHRPGGAAVRDLWDLADGRAESVLESRVRLRCVDAGLVPDKLQLVVRDDHGAVVGRADLAYRLPGGAGWLLVEADGAGVHGSPDALHRDRTRANALTARGHLLLRFTWRDTLDPFTIPQAVRAALRAAARGNEPRLGAAGGSE
ncbi:hypothetical protein [Aquipuribacter hungaricus]|uniref:DUF559 domain-containing protein n=1 Tax=Aquipuribacter hungaricus TaxID=545624 RepID=A0ABV7WB33_9MICO